jgi:hypothetical protein
MKEVQKEDERKNSEQKKKAERARESEWMN